MPAQNPTIVRGTNDKPVASETLAAVAATLDVPDSQLFIGYPIIGAVDGPHPIDALYLAPTVGLVVIDLVEGTDLGDYEDRQDDAATKLQSRLLTHKALVERRRLIIPIHTLTFAPGIPTAPQDTDYPVANNSSSLRDVIRSFLWADSDPNVFAATLSALQNITTIRRSRTARSVMVPDSRGGRLQALERSIATLDATQSKAVIETVDAVQRIRGLAGSGKTIVLALKAAYLHAQHPDWDIAVTFNSRSLKAHFERLISAFSIEQTGDEPDWSRLRIINSWGAPGGPRREGIYHEFCTANNIDYLNYNEARAQWGSQRAFEGACRKALGEVDSPVPIYDALLVDEAQDLPIEFLRLCYGSLRTPKRLVYAYDELQNLSGGAGLPPASEIFGFKDSGEPEVSFETTSPHDPQRDIILEKCYRNSRPVLVTAHALGFGTYRRPPRNGAPGLVQMFDEPDLWTDVGYKVTSGSLVPGAQVVLTRTPETSPRFLEDHSPLNDLIEFYVFQSDNDQAVWIAEAIARNLERDELRHDDIIVINTDPLTSRTNFGPVRKALLDRGIMSHVAGVDTDADIFFRPEIDSVTCTGIYRAKGNEAGMVYIINAEEAYTTGGNLARVRNRLFTAITRSKAWVRVLGVGSHMEALAAEFESVKASGFELRFKYPTEKERAQLQIVHRDMTAEEVTRVKKRRENLEDIVAALAAGTLYREDLDENVVEQLRALLGSTQ